MSCERHPKECWSEEFQDCEMCNLEKDRDSYRASANAYAERLAAAEMLVEKLLAERESTGGAHRD